MAKKFFVVCIIFVLLLTTATTVLAEKPTGFDNNGNALGLTADTGFDQYGYNRVARIFSGTASSWCTARGSSPDCFGTTYMNDKLVMKWNAEWDRGNAEDWSNPPYDAWENNEWNGKGQDGSGEVWHYKIVWVGNCGADYTPLANGGYCIWGQFEAIMDQGTGDGVHYFLTHASPTGYGSYP